jgi:hypothetical protein
LSVVVMPYLDQKGNPLPMTEENLAALLEPIYSSNGHRAESRPSERPPKPRRESAEGDRPEEISSWRPVDLEAIVEADVAAAEPALLPRSDGVAILYPGKRHLIASEPEGGKSWLAMKAAAEEIQAGHRVLYLDFEATAQMALERLEALRVPLRDILEFFAYVRPDGPLDIELDELAPGVALVVLDGITEAMQLLGLDPNSSIDTARFYAMTGRPLADAGCAVLNIDHVVKDREGRGRWAIGSQHKIAGVDVAFGLETRKPFGRGIVGAVSTLRLLKDRPGFLQ